jgi:hypothetical protein
MLIRLSKLSETRIDRAWRTTDRLVTEGIQVTTNRRAYELYNRASRAMEYARQARKCLTLLHYQREADTLNRMRCGGAR